MKLTKKNFYYIFLTINAILWSLIQLFRNVVSIDVMEAVVWGELVDFGTNKHPPLSGWLMAGFYNLLGQNDIAAYILGQICIFVGLVFVYKLARMLLSEEKAFCASMIMTCCYYYTFIVFIDNFNCNFLSMAIWPMIAYYYYKSIREEKIKDWCLFGFASGLGFITKYQVVFLFFALFIHLIFCERKQFKQKGMYLAVLVGLAVIAPHVVWLYNNDFFSFAYMSSQAEGSAENAVLSILSPKRIFFPLKYTADQLLSVVPCIVLYVFTAMQAKNIGFLKDKDSNLSDKVFVFSICVLPVVTQGLMGFFTGNIVHGIWGSIMVSFVGIALFYFFPIEFKENTFWFFLKVTFAFMFMWLIAMFIFAQLHVKKNISFPYQTILKDFDQKWDEQTSGAPLKYVGGNIDYIFQFRMYDKSRPTVILETFGHKNPWIDHEDVLKSGVIVTAKTPEELYDRVKETAMLLPADYEIIPQRYDFEVKNKLNKSKKFNFYYVIIPPQRND